MTPESILAVGRVAERLLVCIFAGSSLAYGWNLFRVGVVGDQSAELKAGGWRANLKRVGPGVFFALFGAAVLVVSLKAPLSVPAGTSIGSDSQSGGTKERGSTSAGRIIYAQGDDPATAKGWVASINTLQSIAKPSKFKSLSESMAVSKSMDDLTHLRDALVIQHFGSDLMQEYREADQRLASGSTISAQERQRLSGISEWMHADRILE